MTPPDVTTISGDVPCAACGYNLRGLTIDGRCPECGAAVGPSVAAFADRGKRRPVEPVEASDPRWRREVWGGLVLLSVSILFCAATVTSPEWTDLNVRRNRTLPAALAATYWAVAAWGVWKAGAPDAAGAHGGEGQRRVMRGAVAAYAAMPALFVAHERWPLPELVLLPVALVLWCGVLVAAATFFAWAAHLGRRLRAPWVAGQCAVLAWCVPPLTVLAALAGGRGWVEMMVWPSPLGPLALLGEARWAVSRGLSSPELLIACAICAVSVTVPLQLLIAWHLRPRPVAAATARSR